MRFRADTYILMSLLGACLLWFGQADATPMEFPEPAAQPVSPASVKAAEAPKAPVWVERLPKSEAFPTYFVILTRDNCEPCKRMYQAVRDAECLGRFICCKFWNIDREPFPGLSKVTFTPITLILDQNHHVMAAKAGAMGEKELEQWLKLFVTR